MMTDIYTSKQETYYTNTRKDLLSLLPINKHQKVLEIGAGGGDTLLAIKKMGLAREVFGIELFDLPGTNQKNSEIDGMIIADIEKDEINLPSENFDVVICGDVLEHLVDPWSAAKKIANWTVSGGYFISSIPNIRELSAFSKIYLKGDFGYDPAGGILDKTHLRFFCKKNMRSLIETNGYKILKMTPSFMFVGMFEKGINLRKFCSAVTFRVLDQFLALQYIILATKI